MIERSEAPAAAALTYFLSGGVLLKMKPILVRSEVALPFGV